MTSRFSLFSLIHVLFKSPSSLCYQNICDLVNEVFSLQYLSGRTASQKFDFNDTIDVAYYVLLLPQLLLRKVTSSDPCDGHVFFESCSYLKYSNLVREAAINDRLLTSA
jgi:hypothetical protein